MALGIVLTPYGKIPKAFPAAIASSYGANGTYLDEDPYFNQRGEAGFYHDTFLGDPCAPAPAVRPSWWQRLKARLAGRQLGAIPTDFQMATNLNYTPVNSAWIHAEEGYIQPPPWVPRRPGLGDGVPATVEDVVGLMNAHNDRVFALTLVSTVRSRMRDA